MDYLKTLLRMQSAFEIFIATVQMPGGHGYDEEVNAPTLAFTYIVNKRNSENDNKGKKKQ
jgi:hypothetical protein